MKNRSLAIGLVASLALSLGTVAVTPAPVMAAEQTMADQYQPVFPKPSKPFALNPDEMAEHPKVSGVPSNARISILNANWGTNERKENGLLVAVDYTSFTNPPYNSLHFQVFDQYHYAESGVSNTVKFLVDYPDGSSETVEQTFTIFPAQRLSYDPKLAESTVLVGQNRVVKIDDLPTGAKLQVLDTPSDWTVKNNGASLSISAPKPEEGTIYGRVTYADGSSESVAFDVTAVDKKAPVPSSSEPTSATTPVRTITSTTTAAPVTKRITETKTATVTSTETATPGKITETVTESGSPVTVVSTITQPPARVTTTVTEKAQRVTTTATVTAEPVTATVTDVQTVAKTADPVTTTVTEKANPVTTTVTEKANPVTTTVTEKANPVTATVTKTVDTPESAATVTLTEKAEAEVVTTTVVKPATPSTETVTVTESPEAAIVTKTVKEEQAGSSTGSIIALVIGLLGLIGGLGAAVVGNPQLREALPF